MFDFLALMQECAPSVHPDTMRRVVHVESSFNPFAIGVVGGYLARQPRNRDEALAAVRMLDQHKMNYSVGLAQVNMKNFSAHGLTATTAFEPCRNLQAGSRILSECFARARRQRATEQMALLSAFSCYESGNFNTGFKDGYVQKIVRAEVSARPPRAGGFSPTATASSASTSNGQTLASLTVIRDSQLPADGSRRAPRQSDNGVLKQAAPAPSVPVAQLTGASDSGLSF